MIYIGEIRDDVLRGCLKSKLYAISPSTLDKVSRPNTVQIFFENAITNSQNQYILARVKRV